MDRGEGGMFFFIFMMNICIWTLHPRMSVKRPLDSEVAKVQHGVVVGALALINKVNLRRAWLVLRMGDRVRFSSRCWTLISLCNQATQSQLTLPSLRGR